MASIKYPTANIMLKGEKKESFPTKIKNRDVFSNHFYSTLYYSSQCSMARINKYPGWKARSKTVLIHTT